MNTNAVWGWHMLLDCASGNDNVKDKNKIIEFVKELVIAIDMVPFGEPYCEHFATHDPEKAGYSMFQMIETSNISGHFVDKNLSMFIDIFSCKPYDKKIVLKLVNKYFAPKVVLEKFCERVIPS